MRIIRYKDHTISYDDSPEMREAVFQAVLGWFHENEAYSGECIAQSDGCQIALSNLLEYIADKIIKFDVKWEDNA